MNKRNISIKSPGVFLNEILSSEEKESLKILEGQIIEKKDFIYKEISLKNNLKIYLIDIKEEKTPLGILRSNTSEDMLNHIPQDIMRAFMDSFDVKNSILVLPRGGYETEDFFQKLFENAPKIGQKILNKYHESVAQCSEEVELANSNLLVTQNAIISYLKENKIEKIAFEIDFNPEDEKSVNQWFREIHKKTSRLKEPPAYNDLDYIPFLINGVYVIENIASSKLFIYKENPVGNSDGNGSWYVVKRNEFDDNIAVLHDACYDSNQYIVKAINEQCNCQTLLAEMENGKIIKASHSLPELESMQNYIFDELEKQGLVKRDVPQESFEKKISTYRVIHDVWKKMSNELYFFIMLNDKNLQEKNGQVHFENYIYIKDGQTQEPNFNEKQIVENLNLFLEREKVKFPNVEKLTENNKNLILEYLQEKIKPLKGLNPTVQSAILSLESILLANKLEKELPDKNQNRLKKKI